MGNAHLAGRWQPWRCHLSCCFCVSCEATVSMPSLCLRAPISSFDLDLHLWTTNNCVSKPVYHKVQTVMGVSRATKVHLRWARQYGHCAELKRFFLVTISKEPVSFPWDLKRSQIGHSRFLSQVSQLSTLPSGIGNSE